VAGPDSRVGLSWWLKIAIALVSVFAALAVCEGVLRARGLYRPPDNPIKTSRPDLYRADPNVGYTLWPSASKTYTYPVNSTDAIALVSNSDGFRSPREFDERDGRVRILMVGDSFVFGQGVRAEDRVTEQLEAMDPRWRVDNMGMTGWGLDLMIRAIEHYHSKAAPDVVILAIYTDDFRRLLPYYAGVGFPYAKFDLDGGELKSVPFPFPRFWERPRLVQWLYQTRWQRARNRFDLNEALLDRYLKDAAAFGFKPVVAFFPGLGDTEEDRQRRGFLAGWTAAHGVPYADLTDALHGAGVDKVYIRDNWHWNPLGHKIAAQQLYDLLHRTLGPVLFSTL
jgi:hypothetical protein